MAIVSTQHERPDSPEYEATLNERKYTRRWRVIVDSYADGPLTVASTAAGIPRLYSPYLFGNEIDSYALLRELKATRLAPNSLTWIVTGIYTTPPARCRRRPCGTKIDTNGANDNPLLMLPEIETTFEKFQDYIYYIYNKDTGKIEPCKNSAEEVFNPPPHKDASRLVLQITRNEDIQQPHPAADITFIDTVNSDPWWGAPPGTWKCMGISAKRETKQVSFGLIIPYLKVTYKFEARNTWDILLLDAGTYYWNTSQFINNPDAKKLRFRTDDGHPTVGPLDGTGLKLMPGKPAVFLPFRVYQRSKFANLNLPQSFAFTG